MQMLLCCVDVIDNHKQFMMNRAYHANVQECGTLAKRAKYANELDQFQCYKEQLKLTNTKCFMKC